MSVLAALGGLPNWLSKKKCSIDNVTFKLHYQVTFALLGICCALSTSKQFFGDHISCIVEGVDKGVFETYCWIHGTFTLQSHLVGKQGQDFPHPGVGPWPSSSSNHELGFIRKTDEGDEIRHAWYQWVYLMLGFQAILCYIPHSIWKNLEGGRIKMLLQGLESESQPLVNNPSQHKDKREVIVRYVERNLHKNNFYAIKFFFCEFLNFVNIVGQMYLMDTFLGRTFTQYGTDLLSVSNMEGEERIDPMSRTFPKMTKCTFHKYGPSGTIQNFDGLCILPLNIIIEKIYIVLWFWYVALAVWTAIFLVYRVATVASRQIRFAILKNSAKNTNDMDINAICEKLYLGDWLMLMQLSKNINNDVFQNLLDDLRDNLDPKRKDNLEMHDNGNSFPTNPLYSTLHKD